MKNIGLFPVAGLILCGFSIRNWGGLLKFRVSQSITPVVRKCNPEGRKGRRYRPFIYTLSVWVGCQGKGVGLSHHLNFDNSGRQFWEITLFRKSRGMPWRESKGYVLMPRRIWLNISLRDAPWESHHEVTKYTGVCPRLGTTYRFDSRDGCPKTYEDIPF